MKLFIGFALASALLHGQYAGLYYCTDAGSTDTYACTFSSQPVPLAYQQGFGYSFQANTANTGAATINFNSLGAKTIVKVAGGVTTALADNDIRAGQMVNLIYDGTNMQMQSTLGVAPSDQITQGTLASIPGTCKIADLYLATDAPYSARCSSANTWTYLLQGFGNFNPLATGNFTSFNLSATVVTNNGGVLNLYSTETADGLRGYCASAPATPFTVTVPVSYAFQDGAAQFGWLGFSDATKYEGVIVGSGVFGTLSSDNVEQWNTTTSRSGSVGTSRVYGSMPVKAFRVTDDGANKIFYTSADGINFTTRLTETRTTFLTATQYCIGIRTVTGGSVVNFSALGILVN